MRLMIFVDSKEVDYQRKQRAAIKNIQNMKFKEGNTFEVLDVQESEENRLAAGSLKVEATPCFIKFDDAGVELGRVTELGKGLLPPFLEELKE